MFNKFKNGNGLAALVLVALIPILILAGETFSGKCVSVADGDTIGVMKEGKEVKIRLDGIDCPESGQDFSSKAKRFTSDLAYDKDVEVRVKEFDKYGRSVARVIVGGKDISVELVKAGLAWHYKQYSTDTVLARAEVVARQGEVGLWALNSPVAPWDYRHGTASIQKEEVQPSPQKQQTETVYITRTGAKYHRAGCQYLRKSSIPISKTDATSRGYSPCSRCNP